MGLERKAVLRAARPHTVHYERRRPEQTILHCLVREHLATFLAQVEATAGTGLPEFVKDEFDAFLECAVLAHRFLRVRCADCAHEKLVAFSCKRRGFCPSCGARRMAESAAHLVDKIIPRVPVRQWVLSFPVGLRILFAAHPGLLTPVLRIIHRVIAGFLLKQAGLKHTTADTGAVTLVQRFGSAANLNIHLHCLVLDGVYRRTEGAPVFQQARAPSRDALAGLLDTTVAPRQDPEPPRPFEPSVQLLRGALGRRRGRWRPSPLAPAAIAPHTARRRRLREPGVVGRRHKPDMYPPGRCRRRHRQGTSRPAA
jgi:ribosomal protein S27E